MGRSYDLTGQRFGRLMVRARALAKKTGQIRWACTCECGNTHEVDSWQLRNGKTQSCGCLLLESRKKNGARHRRHGEGGNGKETPEYQTWAAMLSRCNNPNHRAFRHYGGRGIKVCERWSLYENFLADMGRRPEPEFSLDRIDNEKGYSPENCRWVTAKVQANNRRPVHLDKATSVHHVLEHAGVAKRIVDWLAELGLSQNTYRERIRAGRTPHEAVFAPRVHTGRKPRTRS